MWSTTGRILERYLPSLLCRRVKVIELVVDDVVGLISQLTAKVGDQRSVIQLEQFVMTWLELLYLASYRRITTSVGSRSGWIIFRKVGSGLAG